MESASTQRRILIVDDYEDVAEMMAVLLHDASSACIETFVAHNGRDALSMAIAYRPAVVLLDIDMPIMNGVDAALAIRAALAIPPLLIGITGNLQMSVSMRANQAFDKVLTKPVDIDKLIALVV